MLLLLALLTQSEPVVRLGERAFHHGDWCWDAAYSPDGKTLATCGAGPARLWDAASGALKRQIGDHERENYSVCFSGDGRRLATASTDKTLRVWDVESGKELHRYAHSAIGHNALAGDVLAAGTSEGTVRLWDAASGKELHTLRGATGYIDSVALSPDGAVLAAASFKEQSIHLFDAKTSALLRTLEGKVRAVTRGAFSPDGKEIASGNDEGRVIVWDVATGKVARSFEMHDRRVDSVAFSPDGKRIASSSRSRILACDAASGKLDWMISPEEDKHFRLTFAPKDGTLAVVVEGSVWLCDESGKWSARRHTKPVNSMAFTSDGATIASVDGHVLLLWSVSTGRLMRSVTARGHYPMRVACVPGLLATAGRGGDRAMRFWNPDTGAEVAAMKVHAEILALACSADGKTLASGLADRTLRLWDVAKRELRHTIDAYDVQVTAVAFSPDGAIVASGCGGMDKRPQLREIGLWDVATGRALRALSGHSRWVYALAFSPDGRLLTSCGADGHIRVWDVARGDEVLAIESRESARAVVFTRDGRFLATMEDSRVRLWELASGTEAASWAYDGTCLATDGERIACGLSDGSGAVWSLKPKLPRDTPDVVRAALDEIKIDSKQVAAWIATLDDDDPAVREAAMRGLDGVDAEAELRESLKGAGGERRANIEKLLASLRRPTATSSVELRWLRASEAMERAGERAILERIAADARWRRVREDARAALKRIQ